MALVRFSPPAGIDDAGGDRGFLDRWHDLVSGLIAESTELSGRGAYLNPALGDVPSDRERAITWTAMSRPGQLVPRADPSAG
jgi:hypothetical protein